MREGVWGSGNGEIFRFSLDLFDNQEKREKLKGSARAVDEIRRRFGYFSIQRAAMYQDKVLSHLDAGTHTVPSSQLFSWIMGGIDLKKSINQKTGRKLSVHCKIY